MELYKEIAQTLGSIIRCKKTDNHEWLEIHNNKLDGLFEHLPSGSGF